MMNYFKNFATKTVCIEKVFKIQKTQSKSSTLNVQPLTKYQKEYLKKYCVCMQ